MIALSGGGPGGPVLDADDDRLYVLTRFDNSISILDTHRRTEIAVESVLGGLHVDYRRAA